MEIHQRLVPYRVTMKCDFCDEGEMLPTGITLMSYPPYHQHSCNRCGSIDSYIKTYPTIEYKIEDENV